MPQPPCPTPASAPRSARRPRRGPRSSHGDWAPAADRADPVEVLEAEDADRVPELVPIRYGRMLVSPFAFYRGAAAIMAADLAATPTRASGCSSAATRTCRTSAPSRPPERSWSSTSTTSTRRCPGPFEWDLKRLAASFEIAGRDRGFDDAAAARDRARRRRAPTASAMRELAELSNLDIWYARLDVSQIREAFAPAASKQRAQERSSATSPRPQRKDRHAGLAKLTTRVDGELRIVSDPPLLVPLEELSRASS